MVGWGTWTKIWLIRLLKYAFIGFLLLNALQTICIKPPRVEPSIVDNLFSHHNHFETYSKTYKGITVEKIVFQAKINEINNETITRSGILITRPYAKGTVLICHGYSCNKYDISFLRTLFPEYNSLVFDFRAHGENRDGQYCTLGKDEAFDVMGAAEFIKNHPVLKHQKLYGYGFSMGAVSLIEAQAKKHLFDALILDCPFDSTDTILSLGVQRLSVSLFGKTFNLPGRDFLKQHIFNPYVQPIAKFIFKMIAGIDATKIQSRLEHITPAKSMKKITIPCLLIHCRNDEKIPVDAIKNIYNSACGFKRLWLTNGRGHCDSYFFNPERYFEKTNHFLSIVNNNDYAKKIPAKVSDDV